VQKRDSGGQSEKRRPLSAAIRGGQI